MYKNVFSVTSLYYENSKTFHYLCHSVGVGPDQLLHGFSWFNDFLQLFGFVVFIAKCPIGLLHKYDFVQLYFEILILQLS